MSDFSDNIEFGLPDQESNVTTPEFEIPAAPPINKAEPTNATSIGEKFTFLGTLLKKIPVIYILFITLIVVLISVLVFIVKNNRLQYKNDKLEDTRKREMSFFQALKSKYDILMRENDILRKANVPSPRYDDDPELDGGSDDETDSEDNTSADEFDTKIAEAIDDAEL